MGARPRPYGDDLSTKRQTQHGLKPAKKRASARDSPQSTHTPQTNISEAWKPLSRRSKTAVIALVAVLAGWNTIKDEAIDPLVGLYSSRQPGQDERNLAKLRPGMLLSELQSALGEPSFAVLDQTVQVTQGNRTVTVRDELTILDTVFVQAFVDEYQQVLAYTVTARDDSFPKVEALPGYAIRLGFTSITDIALLRIQNVAGVCGAHIAAYYEASSAPNAELGRTIAVGSTAAGALPAGHQGPACPPRSLDALPLDTVANDLASSDQYNIELRLASPQYLEEAERYRQQTVVNTITVTAPSVSLSPGMISLHPDTLANLQAGPAN
jgi:hypothetical protein